MKSTTQLNVVIPEALARRIRSDCALRGVKLNDYGRQAFERFLSLTPSQREIYLGEKGQRKIVGRKVKESAR